MFVVVVFMCSVWLMLPLPLSLLCSRYTSVYFGWAIAKPLNVCAIVVVCAWVRVCMHTVVDDDDGISVWFLLQSFFELLT